MDLAESMANSENLCKMREKTVVYTYSKRSGSTSAMLDDTRTTQIKYLASAWKTLLILKQKNSLSI